MTAIVETAPATDRELVLTRIIDAPREKLFRAWTDPELLKQWFAPLPYTTPVAELDVRPGGANLVVMRGPDGKDLPNRGVYLEVVENERLVFTDAYTKAWEPSQKPFMTVILTFEDVGGSKTRYTARVRHWTVATARRTRRWASTAAGACAPISSPRWWPGFNPVALPAASVFGFCSIHAGFSAVIRGPSAAREPGIHNHSPRVWRPGSRLWRAPE